MTVLAEVAAPIPAAAIQIQPFNEALVDAMRDFNRRLAAGGVPYRLPESPTLKWLPKVDGREMFQECYVAVENGVTVRGGYILKRQSFMVEGVRRSVACYRIPLSEGLIDLRYGAVGVRLLSDALKREPLLYVLGIGSMHERLSRMLTALSWRLNPVPFYFKVVRPFRVARHLTYIRTNIFRRVALDAAAFSGGAWLASQIVSGRGRPAVRGVVTTVEPAFGSWADEVWYECQHRYPIIGDRSRQALDVLYPADDHRFIRVKVDSGGDTIGWALLIATDMRDNKYLGNLRVGTIVDCLAVPDADKFRDCRGGAVYAGERRRSHRLESNVRSVGPRTRGERLSPGPVEFFLWRLQGTRPVAQVERATDRWSPEPWRWRWTNQSVMLV